MLDDPNTLENIRTVVGLGVVLRRDKGEDDETIRREVLDTAKRQMRKHLPDDMDHETAVATAQREIDRILSGGEPFADLEDNF